MAIIANKGRLYEQSFRVLQIQDPIEQNASARRAAHYGWQIFSPVDVQLCPLNEILFSKDASKLEDTCFKHRLDYVWEHEKCCVGVRTEMSLEMYDYATDKGWEAMFKLKLGASLQWRLGFAANLRADQCLVVQDDWIHPKQLCVPCIYTADEIHRLNNNGGLSITVRPTEKISIRRGDVIARLSILTKQSMRLNS